MPPTTTEQFLELVRKSGLVDEKALCTFLESVQAAPPQTPRELARAMVRQGLLSGFQAEQLLQGKTRGFTIGAKYMLLEHLGAGGMGTVYLCQHLSMRRRVAIKVLPVARAKDPSYLERFYREARAVAALDHPNIVRAHDIDHDGPLHFLVMEYVDGSNLQRIVDKHGPLDVLRACHYIRQAALGLAHAHRAGLVHRDVKPSNILLDRTGVVKILDLGLARFFHGDDNLSKKYDETVLGTSDYLAPEQALNSNVDGRADIYSLGATFYFLLTGRTLFEDASPAQKMIWHQTRQPRPIRSLRPGVPAALAELIEQKMLAKEPAQRFQTPDEVARALETWTQTPVPPPAEEEMPRMSLAARRAGQGENSPPPTAADSPSKPGTASKSAWEVSGVPVVRSAPTSAPDPEAATVVQVNLPTPAPADTDEVPAGPESSPAAGRKAGGAKPGAQSVKRKAPSTKGPTPRTPRHAVPRVVGLLLLGAVVTAGAAAGAWWAFFAHPAAPPTAGNPPVAVRPQDSRPDPGPPRDTAPGQDVSITAEKDGRRIRAPKYEAVVAPDGCMTSLKVAGVETLYVGGPISRGVYFFTQATGTLKLPSVAEPAPNTVTAKGDRASIRYEFGPDTLTCTAANLTDEPLMFFIVFSQAVTAVAGDKGEWAKTPAQKPWTTTTWFAGKARLAITGGTRIWGPWGETKAQVWDGALKPKETRKVVLRLGTPSAEEEAKVAALTAVKPAANPDLPLQSPLDYQVFQRYSRFRGQITLKGSVKPACDRLEMRLTGTSLEGKLPDRWQPVALDKLNRTFDATIPTPAGGWYRLELRALQEGKAVAQTTVEHVGIGEVFVCAGQSNSTNCSEEQLRPASGMVSSFSGSEWQLAEDPQPGVHDKTGGGSCWPPFGDAMYEKCKVPIGIASTGHSGSSVTQWQPEGEYFKWMMTRIRQLGSGGFRAVLWHQGESDVGRTTDEYVRLLTNTIQASKKEAGWDFPWLVAQASYHNPARPSFPTVREAQRKLWESKVALEGPDTDTLTGDNRDSGGKGIHFSGKGQRAHGKLWAEKVGAHLDKVLAE